MSSEAPREPRDRIVHRFGVSRHPIGGSRALPADDAVRAATVEPMRRPYFISADEDDPGGDGDDDVV